MRGACDLRHARGGLVGLKKHPHTATHGRGEADLSAIIMVANPASRSDTGLGFVSLCARSMYTRTCYSAAD